MPEENEAVGKTWRGRVGKLSQNELDVFLAEGVVARLACLDHEGWPYVVPVWFQSANGGFYLIPRERSAWAEYLRADRRVAMTIDEAGRQRKVTIKGEAELLEEPNVGGRWVAIANQMSYRYLGDHGPDYLVPTLNEPRWLFFVRPLTITTWQGVDWAKRYKHAEWGA
ncbi:MAG: pyridoxamine 5'-phosphate oxidase family protein [Chloroflexota bacterium]|nr:pyridoxamine 5'-phosphate oxidase family protein [Chloroflexota bacterium]